MAEELTEHQRAILDYYWKVAREEMRRPSMSEAARAFGVSRQTMRANLLSIQRKGYIKMEGSGQKDLRITLVPIEEA